MSDPDFKIGDRILFDPNDELTTGLITVHKEDAYKIVTARKERVSGTRKLFHVFMTKEDIKNRCWSVTREGETVYWHDNIMKFNEFLLLVLKHLQNGDELYSQSGDLIDVYINNSHDRKDDCLFVHCFKEVYCLRLYSKFGQDNHSGYMRVPIFHTHSVFRNGTLIARKEDRSSKYEHMKNVFTQEQRTRDSRTHGQVRDEQ